MRSSRKRHRSSVESSAAWAAAAARACWAGCASGSAQWLKDGLSTSIASKALVLGASVRRGAVGAMNVLRNTGCRTRWTWKPANTRAPAEANSRNTDNGTDRLPRANSRIINGIISRTPTSKSAVAMPSRSRVRRVYRAGWPAVSRTDARTVRLATTLNSRQMAMAAGMLIPTVAPPRITPSRAWDTESGSASRSGRVYTAAVPMAVSTAMMQMSMMMRRTAFFSRRPVSPGRENAAQND